MNNKVSCLLEKLYVDNSSLSYINCHRLQTRSFFINNRQFNICARCTGIVTGIAISPVLWFFSFNFLPVFFIGAFCLCLDGFTQLFGWRTSNNKLRLLTGLVCGILLPYSIAFILVWLFNIL